MISLNWGEIPPTLTIDEPYPMELNATDKQTVCAIINQGIDSHLEVVVAKDHGLTAGTPIYHKGRKEVISVFRKHSLKILDSASMRTFLRRCVESDDENAQDLASGIMSTLGYEWV